MCRELTHSPTGIIFFWRVVQACISLVAMRRRESLASEASSQSAASGDTEVSAWEEEFPDDDLGTDVRELDDSASFYVQNQRFLLTYKTHVNKIRMFEFLELVNGGKRLQEAYCAHERASSKTDYPHTHVYVDFGRQVKSKSARKFDFEGIHPNIKFVVTKKRERLYRYIAKEDPELAELLAKYSRPKGCITGAVAAKQTLAEALELVQRPSDVFGIERLYELTRVVPEQRILQYQPHSWQIPLLRRLEYTADDRTIECWWEPQGRCGKSTLCKYLVATDPTRFYVLQDPGSARDTATTLQEAFAGGWTGHCLLVNLTRDFMEKEHIYKELEGWKDGLITPQKYKGKTMTFDHPHVIVFTNWPLAAKNGDGRLRISEDRIKNYRIVVTDEDREKWKPAPPVRVMRLACLAELDGDDEDKKDEEPATVVVEASAALQEPPPVMPGVVTGDLWAELLAAYADPPQER